MAHSITEDTEIFILSLQGHRDCSRHSRCQDRGSALYESLITWIKTNQEHDEYETVVTDIFSLLKKMHEKRAFSNQTFCELSKRTITVVSSFPKTVTPELQLFLDAQRLN